LDGWDKRGIQALAAAKARATALLERASPRGRSGGTVKATK
jgi:hypothetical protein